MKTTRFEGRCEEALAVRLFLWVGLVTTVTSAGLALVAMTRPAFF